MAGGPPSQNQNLRIKIDNTRGTHIGPILVDNDVRGQFTCHTNYTGPPSGEEAAPVVPRQQDGDGTINIRNDGSLSNQPIIKDNRFGGDVDLKQNINIQGQINNEDEGRDEGQMNLR